MAESIFGPTVDEVRQAISERDRQRGLQFAQLPRGRGAVALAGQAGSQLGRGVQGAFGVSDPAIQKAQVLEEIKEAVDLKGLDVRENPVAFFDEVIKEASKRGATEIVQNALQIKQQFEGTQSEITGREASSAFNLARSREILRDLNISNQEKLQMARAMERAKAQGQAEGQPVKFNEAFPAVTDTGDRITVLRTNKGLMTQTTGEGGQVILTPVDSTKIREVRTEEVGTTGELGLPGTEGRQLRDAEVATRNFINTTQDALRLLRENPDINTFTAGAAGIVNDLNQEVKAAARALGFEVDKDVLIPDTYNNEFEELGIENRRMKSLITSLAFQAAAASGQTGRAISDRDVRRFIEEIGAQAADPEAFSRVLVDVANRTARNFQTNFQVRTREPFRGDLGTGELPEVTEQPQQPQLEISEEEEQLIRKHLPRNRTITPPGQ